MRRDDVAVLFFESLSVTLGTCFRERVQCPVAVARVHVAHGGASAFVSGEATRTPVTPGDSNRPAQVLSSPGYDRDEALCPQIELSCNS